MIRQEGGGRVVENLSPKRPIMRRLFAKLAKNTGGDVEGGRGGEVVYPGSRGAVSKDAKGRRGFPHAGRGGSHCIRVAGESSSSTARGVKEGL